MLAYKLGVRVSDAAELQRLRDAVMLKGLPSVEAVVEQAVGKRTPLDTHWCVCGCVASANEELLSRRARFGGPAL